MSNCQTIHTKAKMRKMAFLQANWYKAEQYCRFHNMHLASINSEEEQRELEVGLVTEFKKNLIGRDKTHCHLHL